MMHLPRTTLALASILFAATCAPAQRKPAKDPSACSLLTPDEIKAVISAPVQPGTPSAGAGSGDCTWKSPKGEDRVYISLRSSDDWHNLHDTMRGTGRLTPLTGIAEDAFFVASTGSSAVLYLLKRRHEILLTVDGPGYSRAQNEGAEKALAPNILNRLQ